MKTMIRRSMLLAAFCSLPLLAQYSTPIHDVDNGARQPYTDGGVIDVTNGSAFINLATVPAGKRLVIETISFDVFMPTGQLGYLQVGTVQSGVFSSYHHVVPGLKLYTSTSQFDRVGNSSALKMYVDPGAALNVYFVSAYTTNQQLIQVNVMVSGYYVNLP